MEFLGHPFFSFFSWEARYNDFYTIERLFNMRFTLHCTTPRNHDITKPRALREHQSPNMIDGTGGTVEFTNKPLGSNVLRFLLSALYKTIVAWHGG